MTLRLSTPAQRGVLLAVAFFTTLFLSYFSVRNAMAVYYSGLQTLQGFQRAVSLEPADALNWYLLGRYWQYNLEEPDAARAIRSYLSALSLNSVSAEIWLDLAAAYESESNLTAARDAFLHARRAYPLSAEVAWRYGNFLLRQGELAPAFAEMRRAVEADPKRGAEALSRSLRVQPDLDALLDRVLPPLSEAYLTAMRDQTAEGHTANALKIWNRLASIHPHFPLQDSFALVSALVQGKRIDDARRVWDQAVVFSGLADLPALPDSLLWDGGFESGVTGGGFAWLIPGGIRGVQIGFDSQVKHSGNRSLRLMFDGESNVNFAGPCHYVPVQPSTGYRFSAWVRTRALTTNQGIRFQLRSIGTENSPVITTPDVHGTETWTAIEVPWSSPSGVQQLQVCLARFPSDESPNKIQGTAWVDDVALVPESAERPKP